MKKIFIIIFCIGLTMATFIIFNFENEEKINSNSLEEIILKNKDNLSWNLFEDYLHEDLGSGVWSYVFDVKNKDYKLVVSGTSLDENPQWITLVKDNKVVLDILNSTEDEIKLFFKDN